MGVQGLTPFLQKFCPTVLKKYPDRLAALHGKKIVIDGTLMTQRFHYGDHEYPHQHVLSWYRLAKELNRNGVAAICVFDGKERSAAKAQENKRRRDVRQLTLTRGSIEEDRFQRLNSLKDSILQLNSLEASTRREVINVLKKSTSENQEASATLLQEQDVLAGKIIEKIEELLPSEPPSTSPPTPTPAAQAPESARPSQVMTAEDLASQLKDLHLKYKATIAKLVSVSEETPSDLDSTLPIEEKRAEMVMTKTQSQLTTEEGELWESLAQTLDLSTPDASTGSEKGIDNLIDKSFGIASSFRRRNNFPTWKTYNESKEILTAMGIPCIDAIGAVEAEALASSMVLAGHADYVASEDTDVLVYGAPLIRNITGHNDPLLVISGAEVRAQLDLDVRSYVDFALLLGTDFSQRITNIGPMRAYDFIKQHGSIERVLDSIESMPKYKLKLPKKAYMAQVEIARLVFSTLPPVPPLETINTIESDDKLVSEVMQQYQLGRFLQEDEQFDTSYASALVGNMFDDNPYAT